MKAYILKITFEDISPLIWRRVILPADVTVNRIHETIQLITNFQSAGTPYHSFAVETEEDYITNNEFISEEYKGKSYFGKAVKQPTRMKIDSYLQKQGTFIYNYDFGDDWKIRVTLEETVEDYYFGYPTLLDGEGMAPPEDVGGPPGFAAFLEVYADSAHPDHKTTVAWAESLSYRPLDFAIVNENLKSVKYKKTEWAFIDHENYNVKSDKYRMPNQVKTSPMPNAKLIIQYAVACGNLYGYIEYPQFLEIYNGQNEPSISLQEFKALLADSRYAELLKKAQITVQPLALAHQTADDGLLQKTAGKPFYVPEKEELLRYTASDYYEKTDFHEQFLVKLAKDFFGGSTIMVKEILDDLIAKLQAAENYSQIVTQQFFRRFAMKDLIQMNEYAYIISMIANTTRIWENRGHTPSELSAMEKVHLKAIQDPASNDISDKKIGRNDPCLCGSGKKYKKCCGK